MNRFSETKPTQGGLARHIRSSAPMIGGGEMGKLVRDTDWSKTPLGAYEAWPQSLKSSLSLVLNAKGIAALYWGPDQWLLYNDAYGVALGDRHPLAFGRPMPEVLTDIAPVLGPQVAEVLRTGEGFAFENLRMTMRRYGKDEETVWTYSFSPVQGEDRGFAGVLLLATEVTDQARVNTRRKALVDLSDIFRDIEDPAKLAGAANRLLGQALQVSRVGYGTIDHDTETLLREQEWNAPGIKALPERVFLRQLGSFVDELKCGAPNVISDARLDARTVSAAGELEALAGMSFINVPVIESGRLVALLYVNNAEPRFWPQEDLDLIQEFALRLRIAVERSKSAGALRLSEATAQENLQRVQLALSAGAIIGTWHWDLVNDQFTVDEAFATAFGLDPLLGHKGIPFAQIVETVHPDDQAGLATAIKDAVARCGTYAHQYRTRRADGNYYWLEANGRVDCGLDGKPKSFPGVLLDMEERRANEAERARVAKLLQDSEQFLRSVLASSNDCIKVLDLDANLVFMSEGGQRVMEVSDFNAIVGCPWPDFWQDEGNAAARDAVAAAKAGMASNFQGYAETLKGNRRYWDVQVSPIVGTDGRPESILSVSRDITALKEAEEVRAVLNQELSHRMKNTLAMVQAIATQTLRQATSIEEGRKALSLRLGALARAQDILTRADFTEADTQAVVLAAIGPHQTKDDRIRVRGEAFPLTSEQALGLSLAIHELATNAVKYGALSDGCGTVDVEWAQRNGAFHFTWIESGGPAVNPPSKRGFGSTLIERIVASYFGGEAHIAFEASGVQFELNGVEDAAFRA